MQDRDRHPILRSGICVADGGLSLLKLRLTELDDRAEAELITCLREFERRVGLLQQFTGYCYALQRCVRVEPCSPDIANYLVTEITRPLVSGLHLQPSFGGLGGEAKSVEDGNAHVHTHRSVPI